MFEHNIALRTSTHKTDNTFWGCHIGKGKIASKINKIFPLLPKTPLGKMKKRNTTQDHVQGKEHTSGAYSCREQGALITYITKTLIST
jgi:hypothetical protein